MDNANYARILQNMVEEAEENLNNLADMYKGYEHIKQLDERRADIDEAIALVEELGGAPLHTVEEWRRIDAEKARKTKVPLDMLEEIGWIDRADKASWELDARKIAERYGVEVE